MMVIMRRGGGGGGGVRCDGINNLINHQYIQVVQSMKHSGYFL